jgi:hypothetical protein
MKSAVVFAVTMVLMVGSAVANAQSVEYWSKYAGKLPIGSTVRVRTADGRRTTGVLAVVDDTGITIAPKTRRPEPPRHISFDQLTQLEPKDQDGTSAAKAAAIGVATGAGTFFGILLLVLASSGWD